MPIHLVQLSDLHFSSSDHAVGSIGITEGQEAAFPALIDHFRDVVLSDLSFDAEEAGAMFHVVVTGDLTNRGGDEDLNAFHETFVGPSGLKIGQDLTLLPGNHDHWSGSKSDKNLPVFDPDTASLVGDGDVNPQTGDIASPFRIVDRVLRSSDVVVHLNALDSSEAFLGLSQGEAESLLTSLPRSLQAGRMTRAYLEKAIGALIEPETPDEVPQLWIGLLHHDLAPTPTDALLRHRIGHALMTWVRRTARRNRAARPILRPIIRFLANQTLDGAAASELAKMRPWPLEDGSRKELLRLTGDHGAIAFLTGHQHSRPYLRALSTKKDVGSDEAVRAIEWRSPTTTQTPNSRQKCGFFVHKISSDGNVVDWNVDLWNFMGTHDDGGFRKTDSVMRSVRREKSARQWIISGE